MVVAKKYQTSLNGPTKSSHVTEDQMSSKFPTMKVGQPILVIWDDAFVSGGDGYWGMISELSEIRSIHSYGFFLKQTKRYITLAQSSGRGRPNELDGYGGLFAIPLGTIRSIRKVTHA
jgi:hypothetical protein